MSDRQINGSALSYLYAHKGMAFCEPCLDHFSSEYPQIAEERGRISEGNAVCSICGKEGTILTVR
jgi:hypothetical protein